MNTRAWREEKVSHVLRVLQLCVVYAVVRAQNTLGCADQLVLVKQNCSCHNFDDGVYMDCQDASIETIKNALASATEIHSLNIAGFHDSNENLERFTPPSVCIKHIHISHAHIRDVTDNSFANQKKCLETLSITGSKMSYLPVKSFSGLQKIISIDLSANRLLEIPNFSFYGLPLIKLDLKSNWLGDIGESAFASLELSLSEINLSRNNLTTFPLASLLKLQHLRSLWLQWNDISSFPTSENSMLISLEYLDLSSNNFEFISEDCLRFCPSLKTVLFHFNFINNIHYRAFYSLKNLRSLDLSRNRLKVLNPNVFQNNQMLETIDLSHNHLHHIHGLFCNFPNLKNVHLSNNNILEVPKDSFYNSSNIEMIHLDKNSIGSIHNDSFVDLSNLSKLYLDFNFISKVPYNLFLKNSNITKLRLDNNEISVLENDTFKSLSRVSEIRLNNNKLDQISKDIFSHCIAIIVIYLHNNNLNFIQPGTFLNNKHLQYLNIRDNHLSDINDVLPRVDVVLHSLHLDSNAFSRISMFRSEIQVRHLTMTRNKVKFVSLEAMEKFRHTTKIDFSYNEISVIQDHAFAYCNATQLLALSHNFIRTLTNNTFVGLVQLEDLNMSHNKITYIADFVFDGLKKIRNLNLSFNPIKKISRNMFQIGLPLSALELDSCDIQEVEDGALSDLQNLKYLSLQNNSITSKDVAAIDVPGLKHLFLSNNVLESISVRTFSRLPLLEILLLEHCHIDHIPQGTFSFNRNLLRLNLAQNIISMIPKNIFESPNVISEFNMSSNYLDFIPFSTIQNLTFLITLDLADNLLPRIELSGFEKLTKLRHLDLKKNDIKSITAKKKFQMSLVVSLDLSYNRLEILPKTVFETFPKLRYLNVSYNYLVNYDFFTSNTGFTNTLINIDISKNPTIFWTTPNREDNKMLGSKIYEMHISSTNMTNLDIIPLDIFVNLQHLYLQLNRFRRLPVSPFLKLKSLEDLDLSFNRIWQIKSRNFRGLHKLRSLCLSYNNIESIEPFTEDLNNLKILDLSYNKLQNILHEDLINLKELAVLYLNHNNIKYLSTMSMRTLHRITHIDLSHNKLQSISMELLTSVENHIQEISLKDNVLTCNCEKNNTWVWVQDHPKIVKLDAVSCKNKDYPVEKCDVPIISQLSIDKHKDNSVSISWFIRNRTAIKALQILYYSDEADAEIQTVYLENNEVSARIDDLVQNVNYVLCVMALYQDPYIHIEQIAETVANDTVEYFPNKTRDFKMNQKIVSAVLEKSSSNECISFSTMKKPFPMKQKPEKPFELSSILNRRMGLIVGCSLGFIVFFILITVLLYTKIKERKRIAKSDPAWGEMNDYHSINSKDDVLQNSTTVSTDNILLDC